MYKILTCLFNLRMKKLLVFFLFFVAVLIGLINVLFAKDVLPDNVIHLKCNTAIFNTKTALIYPNPFSLSTTIFYTPDKDENISIKLYNAKGLFINELYNEKVIQGRLYEFELRSEEMQSGIYYCIIESENKIIHQRLEIIH